MTNKAITQAAVEAWFLANEVALADVSNLEKNLSPQQSAGLATAARFDGAAFSTIIGMCSTATLDHASATLLGRAVGACFGQHPNYRTLQAAERLLLSEAAWAAFSKSVAAAVNSNPSKEIALTTCLKELVYAFTWSPRRIVSTFYNNTCVMVERYRLQPQLDDLWLANRRSTIFVKHLPAFHALLLIDPKSFLQVIDTFPHSDPVWAILDYVADREDLDSLSALLNQAPTCFVDGKWLPSVKTPVLILAAVELKLTTLCNLISDDDGEPSESFVAAAVQVIRCLTARPDGSCLGSAWMQRLVQERELQSRRRSAHERPSPKCHARLLWELASALPARRDALEWVRSERSIWRRERAVVAVAAAGLGDTKDVTLAMDFLRQVLMFDLGSSGQEQGFVAPWSPERQLIASVIGRHVTPAAWFDELWHDLAPVRDQARHASTVGGDSAGDKAIIAVSWFLFGLDTLDPCTPEHRMLWRLLHKAVHESVLSQGFPLAQESWRARYGFLAAHLANRLVNVADAEVQSDLRDFLQPLLRLNLTLAVVIGILINAGVTTTIIGDSVGKADHLVELLKKLKIEQVWREASVSAYAASNNTLSHTISQLIEAFDHPAPTPPR